jgi:hypothetical protein
MIRGHSVGVNAPRRQDFANMSDDRPIVDARWPKAAPAEAWPGRGGPIVTTCPGRHWKTMVSPETMQTSCSGCLPEISAL